MSVIQRETFSILNLKIERLRFESGLTLLLQHGARSDVCSFQTWIKSGSAHDEVGRGGLAHFLEHLMFTGTSSTPEGELDKWVEENGGQINAATWLDWTYYHAELPSAAVLEFAQKEIERFTDLVFEKKRLETERLVVLSERREQVESDPDALLSEMLWSGVLKEHPYSRPTIGTTKEIKNLSRSDCIARYRSAYSPSRMVVAVCGQFDAESLIECIDSGFDSLDNTALPFGREDTNQDLSPNMAFYSAGFKQEVELTTQSEKLFVALPAPPLNSISFAALEVVHQTILEGETGRLAKRFIQDTEQATFASGFLPSLESQSLYEIAIDLRRGVKADDVVKQLRTELEYLHEYGITQAELERAKNRIELDTLEGLQTAEQRAHALGFWETVTGDCTYSERRLQEYQQLDLDFVNQTIRTWWSPNRLSWVIGRCKDD